MHERIASLKASTEEENKEHEDHELFKYEHDKQLLLWKQRYCHRYIYMYNYMCCYVCLNVSIIIQ